MDNELVSNTGGLSQNQISNHVEGAEEIAQIEQEFASLEADFGDLGLSARVSAPSEMDLLDQATAGTPFALPSAETGGTLSLLDIADGNMGTQEEGFFDFVKPVVLALKRRAERIIRQIVALVRKYAKYAPCIPKVAKAVAAFAAKKFGTALKEALAAMACIKSKA